MTDYLADIDPDKLNILGIFGLLIGGLALFLLGLEFLTGGLKAIAGSKLQSLIGVLTANRFRGVLAGAIVTALLNSSTITTVLMVGFVSAGLMTLAQSVPMIMGANIGSTITAQIIAFDVSRLTPYMLSIGFVLHAFAPREVLRQIGRVVLGLGLLFMGIQLMGESTHPLRTYQPFIDAMQDMRNPLVGVIVGAVFTAIVQSSAATLAVVIALSGQGLMPLEAAITLILGANVGTCGTALLASIGKPPEAVQVGVVHLVFNVLGVVIALFLIPQMAEFVRWISPSHPDLQGLERLAAEAPRQVANVHTLFSVANTLLLIWFTGPIARFAQLVVPERAKPAKPAGDPQYLDESVLTVPALGLQRVRIELTRLGMQVLEVVQRGSQMVSTGTMEEINQMLDKDKESDRLSFEILQYIGRLSKGEHSEEEGQQMVGYTQVTSHLESISGIVGTTLLSVAQQRMTQQIDLLRLRDAATTQFSEAVIRNLEQAIRTIEAPDPEEVAKVIDAKAGIEKLAATARQVVLAKLQLADKTDVVTFRLAMDLIEQGRQIAQFARAIAKNVAALQ
ncbi:phosphate:Na+ symporter [Paraburkholderia atlantica]|uniref:Phosphate:Na+ symporter n=1 Tax=Paraburkholderia atlantica TaxID=2654982 RepID=A0A6I1Q1A8_PARAM|nr:Na/Pi cotransporter family protein [Paraburkholderia atlantica]MBB5417644.1 phosphate:Na+ symporter [Paraburkholderia atlantica]MBB5425738.1 phosphate:Na+ symporter [Paraburkholderia atlantica]MPW06942.1 Na/Pi cotransporter family protein [Paraburkholderia atlantica]